MKLNFTYLILFFVCQFSIAQTKVADNFFRDFNYDNAAELYKEALKKEDSTEHILSRLGDCYFNISKVKEAAFWYKKAIDKYPNINSDYVYKYIQTLRAQKKYEEAIEFVKIFNKNNRHRPINRY